MKFELGKVEVIKRGRKTHWLAEHATYFLTFNLHDAVPQPVRRRIEIEAEEHLQRIRATRGAITAADAQAVKDLMHTRLETVLDRSYGEAHLRNPRLASMVVDAITYFDADRYTLLSWCVMPTHVHVVARLHAPVDKVLHSWKTFTGRGANQLLDRDGPFWQADYYDRCIRDSQQLHNTIEYVAHNPAAAGLIDWPFVRVYSDRLSS